MKRRTNILLDMDLVHDASRVLGTRRTTDTVHTALRLAVDQARRRRLAERDFPDLTLDSIQDMRRPRTTS